MKNKKLISLFFLIFAINITVSAKYDFGIKVNPGLSKIVTEDPDDSRFSFSGNAGAYFQIQLNNILVLGAEFLFVQINDLEKHEFEGTDENGNPTGEFYTSDIWRHVSYVGLPIYCGIKFKRFTINVGFRTSLYLSSSGRSKFYTKDKVYFDDKFDELNIDNYDFGIRIGILLALTERFKIEGNYYYGVNNLLPYDD